MSTHTIIGSSNKVLEIDLSNRSSRLLNISDTDRSLYLGGKGLGLKLLSERLAPNVDPLGANNWMALMMGVFMGTGAPCSGRFAALTKSPLTGLLMSSSCGGPFGMAFKTAGYDGLLITGRSEKPVYLTIKADGVRFDAADELWGHDTQQTQTALKGNSKRGILAIGPAGENRVSFANVASGHRFLGRGGLGAVMGAKNLKAVVAVGGVAKIVPKKPAKFARAKRRANAYIRRNRMTGDAYRSFGTASHVNWCNSGGLLPVHNFRHGSHKKAIAVSGEEMIARYQGRHRTCSPCSILCGHAGTDSDGHQRKIPEYETVGLLGPNLGIFDPDVISRFNDKCDAMGMDTITAGGVLGWVMEADERGLLSTGLKFGQAEGIAEALDAIAHRKGFGDEMAEGTRYLSRKYGGESFAIQVKGLELAAYDPRGSFGQGLAYAVANRGGCHLSAATFALEVALGLLNPHSTLAKAQFVVFFENLYAAVNSLHTCQFTTYAYVLEPPLVKYTPKIMLRQVMTYLPRLALALMDVRLFPRLFNAITGIRLSQRDLLLAGARIHTLERLLNNREGVSRKDDTLPDRFLTDGRTCDPDQRTVPLAPMLSEYYRLRDYSPAGVPTSDRLKRLGIRIPAGIYPPSRSKKWQLIVPGANPFKKYYLAVLMWFVGRAIQAGARVDPAIQKEFGALPARFTFSLEVQPNGPRLVVTKDDQGRPRYLFGRRHTPQIDLQIKIKSLEAAFVLFTFRESTVTAIARDRLIVDGDIAAGCTVIRILDQVEAYLLPKLIASLAIRRYPRWPFFMKIWRRGKIYLGTVAGR